MPLLQSGVNADLSNMPPASVAIIVAGVIVILAIIIHAMGKYGGKIGPVDMRKTPAPGAADGKKSEELLRSIKIAIENQKDEIGKAEESLRLKIRARTESLNKRLQNLFHSFRLCTSTEKALTKSIQAVLFEAANNNNFDSALLPENRDEYLARLNKSIQDEYVSIGNALGLAHCELFGLPPPWEDVKENIREHTLEWSESAVTEEIKHQEAKIKIFCKYKPYFETDSFQSEKTAASIAECEKTVKQLDRHGRR